MEIKFEGGNQMNFPSKAIVEARRARYAPGTRVELVSMDDPYTDLKPGDQGWVTCVDDTGTVFIKWDNGSSLGAVYGQDEIKIVSQKITIGNDIIDQIKTIRNEGRTNMFDAVTVQRLAFEHEFYELVDFIESNRKGYAKFILTGNPEVDMGG
jgi:hypothetical protein